MKTTECSICGKLISNNNYQRHITFCEKPRKEVFWIKEGEDYYCKQCGFRSSKEGIGNHIRLHKNLHGPRHGCGPWNKGLTAETSKKIEEQGNRLHERFQKKELVPSFLGKHHTEESRSKISDAMKGNRNGFTSYRRRSIQYEGAAYKSSWEVLVQKYLNDNKIINSYEPTSFVLEDDRHYTPDFLLEESGIYIEVKGYWRAENKKKFDLFKKNYPYIQIEIWDEAKLRKLKILDPIAQGE